MYEFDQVKFIELCKIVFASDKGSELLKMLEEMYQGAPLFSESSTHMAYNVAKNDVVAYFKYCVKMSDKEVKSLKSKVTSFNSEFNEDD